MEKTFEFGQWVRYESPNPKNSCDAQFIHYLALPSYCTIDINGKWLDVHVSRIKALEDNK